MTDRQKTNRKNIENFIIKLVRILDNSKQLNVKRFEALFATMTDDEFEKYVENMGTDLDETIQIYQLPFEECTLKQIEDAAKFMNIPLEEYIWYRDKAGQKVRSRYRVPVGYIPIKRMQQTLNKKNHVSLDSDVRALKTGQTTGESKVSAVTDLEAYMLSSIGAERIFEELYGPRSDGYDKKSEFYQQINMYGSVDLDELEQDLTKHTTLNTINTYLLASGLRSDLVTPTLKTSYTLKKDLDR